MKPARIIPLVCITACLAGHSAAQYKLSPRLIGSTGNYSTAQAFTLSATTGEPGVETIRSDKLILTQGFQQPPGEKLKDFAVLYNAFSPNKDGINDTWIIYGISEYPDNEMLIFNRWGDRVWAAEGYDNAGTVWSGEHENGSLLPDGTYYYLLKIPSLNTYPGWVQITR